MKIKFTSIPDKIKYPAKLKGILCPIHSEMIEYVCSHPVSKCSNKRKIIQAMNTLSYLVIEGDTIPSDYSPSNLLSLPEIENDELSKSLGSCLISYSDIIWDIDTSSLIDDNAVTINEIKTENIESDIKVEANKQNKEAEDKKAVNLKSFVSKLSDISLKPPKVPQFDYNKIYLQEQIGQDVYTIYTSLPEVPKVQNEISLTTDVNKMSEQDLLNLYPDHFIQTRSPEMYNKIPGIEYDDILGLIIPIQGYTKNQVIDNIIKYPHILKLQRKVLDETESFYKTIEIKGYLQDTLKIWDDLPESKLLPKTRPFIREYVMRRYLLERDIKGIHHKYPICGDARPFITLFQHSDDYIKMGYANTFDIARQCVEARVAYKKSLNPVMRRLIDE